MDSAPGAGQCGDWSRQLCTLLHSHGSAHRDEVALYKLNLDCTQLYNSVKDLASLDGSADELAELRRTLERAPKRIEAGMEHAGPSIVRLDNSLKLLLACVLLGRLAGWTADSRFRLASYVLKHVPTHGTALLRAMSTLLPPLGPDDRTVNQAVSLQLETFAHAMDEVHLNRCPDATGLVRAETLVAWLRAGAQEILARPRRGPQPQNAVEALSVVLCNLCCVEPWAPMRGSIAADRELAAVLLSLLEPFVVGTAAAMRLPQERRPAWRAAATAARAMVSEALLPALRSRLASRPARLPALLVAAGQLLEQLPAEPDARAGEGQDEAALAYSLAFYAGVLAVHATMEDGILQQPLHQRRRLVQELLPSHARLPAVLHLVAGPQLTDASLQGVAAMCEAVVPLADLLSGLCAVIDDSPDGGAGGASSSQPAAASAEQLAVACCTAAAAVTAAVPLLVQVRLQLRRDAVAEQSLLGGVTSLLSYVLDLQHEAAMLCLRIAGRTPGSPGALQQAVFRLHTACCRLAAWLDANRQGGDMPLEAHSLHHLLAALGAAVAAACELQARADAALESPVGQLAPPRAEVLEAMAVAHWPAVRALQACVPAGSPPPYAPGLPRTLRVSLGACIGRGGTLLSQDPELLQLFDQVMHSVPQGANSGALACQLVTAMHGPPLAVLLLLSGRLEAVLEEVLEEVLEGVHAGSVFEAWASNLLLMVNDILPGLLRAAEAAIASASSAGGPPGGAVRAALQAAVDDLCSTQVQEGFLQEWSASRAAAELRQRVLPPASRVAAALQAWWRCPEQQPALQVEAAQVAARRSCAYLRCANVGGEGGPAAGEGVGSLRCSACRAVWYCGTACSHADWRVGHRQVCKALGAVRSLEKEARRQAQAEAAACRAGEESG